MKVIVLHRKTGRWSVAEEQAIATACHVTIEANPVMAHRLVVLKKPRRCSFGHALGHANFTVHRYEYERRWA